LPTTLLYLWPKRRESSVNLSRFWRYSAAIMFLMKYQLSEVMSTMGETTLASCSGVLKLDFCCCVSLLSSSKEARIHPHIQTTLPICLGGCFCLTRLDTFFMLRVLLSPLDQQTANPETLILIIYHLQIKTCLMKH
jgi:hypothetical protein